MGRQPVFAALFAVLAVACLEPRPALVHTRARPATLPARVAPRTGTSAKPPAPTPPAPTTPPPEPKGAIGTAHPLTLAHASPLGNWVVLCQARRDDDASGEVAVTLEADGTPSGDTLDPYLIVGDGAGTAIDGLAGYDPSGRWLVVRREARLRLVDAITGNELDLSSLGIDDRADALPYRQHRSVAFDATGNRMAYLRGRGDAQTVVVRELTTGRESAIDPGDGEVWRVELDPTGHWVVLRVIADDTNKNGRREWPAPEAPHTPLACQGPIPHFAAWIDRGDTPVTRVARSSGGKAKTVDGFVVPLGNAFVVRDDKARLLLEHRGTALAELSGNKCEGRVLHTDWVRKLLVVGCMGPTGRAEVRLTGRGFDRDLGFQVAKTSVDYTGGRSPRLAPFYPGSMAVLVDHERKRAIQLQAGDDVVLTRENLALVKRGDTLLVYDADSGKEHPLAQPVDEIAHVLTSGSVAVVTPFVVDLKEARVLGRVPTRPLAVSASGKLLVALGNPPSGTRLATGPLAWRAPLPPPSR